MSPLQFVLNIKCFSGLGEAGFSMVRLRTIAKQRELFSSIESLSQSSSDEVILKIN
jgi:hypothetical protein